MNSDAEYGSEVKDFQPVVCDTFCRSICEAGFVLSLTVREIVDEVRRSTLIMPGINSLTIICMCRIALIASAGVFRESLRLRHRACPLWMSSGCALRQMRTHRQIIAISSGYSIVSILFSPATSMNSRVCMPCRRNAAISRLIQHAEQFRKHRLPRHLRQDL